MVEGTNSDQIPSKLIREHQLGSSGDLCVHHQRYKYNPLSIFLGNNQFMSVFPFQDNLFDESWYYNFILFRLL